MAGSDEDDAWMLSRKDADTLQTLRDEVWTWRRRDDPLDVIGIAAVAYAIDQILERQPVPCVIRLSWEARNFDVDADDDGFGEGGSADLAISCEGITLSKMNYYSGDHHSEIVAELDPDGDFPHDAVADWIRLRDRIGGAPQVTIDSLELG